MGIQCDHVGLSYGKKLVLEDLTGVFKQGSMTAIVGPNGSGKSTLLKTLLGLLPPSAGAVFFEGPQSTDIAYLSQHTALDRQFPLTVMETVALGYMKNVGLWGAITPAQQRNIRDTLKKVGLEGTEHKPLEALSGGQFQRVLFARLMIQDAPLIFLDEPFTGVDEHTMDDLLALMKTWHQEGRTLLCVLHDRDIVREHFPETLLLARRAIAWGPTGDVLTHENMKMARSNARLWEMEIC